MKYCGTRPSIALTGGWRSAISIVNNHSQCGEGGGFIRKLSTEVRREQIARAAMHLMANQGVKGLKIAGIAHEVGVVPSAIYRHFNNKDQLLDAVLDVLRQRFLGNVQRVRENLEGPIEQLKELLFLHVKLVLEYRALPRILFSEEIYGGHPGRKAQLYQILREYLREVGSMLRLGQKQGMVRSDLDPEVAAVFFLGLIQPSVILLHLSEGAFDLPAHAEKAWPLFEDAIRMRGHGD
jgi:AcrR family transcriptional regulator